MNWRHLKLLHTVLVCLCLVACGASPPDENSPARPAEAPTFSGSASCAACHAETHNAWQSSHHALAMQVATPANVLGQLPAQIDDVALQLSDGELQVLHNDARLPIKYTFGVFPLQQYLVDTGDGRLQTLRASWDSRPQAEGGQRWFNQYDGEDIPPDDPLHWTGMAQNWNSMCADCHSVGVQKGYNPEANSFVTTYAEMNVGCEGCHGPGSIHVADPSQALPASSMLAGREQVDVCARCHARRSQIAEGYHAGQPFLDHYVPELLNPPLYGTDGSIDDEVYVYGSFIASKMFHSGVACGDCHEPHRAELRLNGDALCQQCHSSAGNPRFPSLKLADYAAPEHHQHESDAEGPGCVGCHMPTKTYMGVDVRHDHGFRRPNLARQEDQAVCASCHTLAPDEMDAFAAQYPQTAPASYIDVWLKSGGYPSATVEQQLLKLTQDPQLTGMVRATSLSRVQQGSFGAAKVINAASQDAEPFLRLTSATMLQHLRPARQRGALKRLLADPLRAVRIQAAVYALNNLDEQELIGLGDDYGHALDEYIAAQKLNQERPEANVNLAMLHTRRRQSSQALHYLERALELNPRFIPALLNYAEWLRAEQRDQEAGAYLQRAIEAGVPSATAQYAYALWLVRQEQRELALVHLQNAYQLEADNPQWLYAYSIALHSLGQSNAALSLLREVAQSPVYIEAVMFVHATIARDMAQVEPQFLREATDVATRLLKRAPGNLDYQRLLDSLTQ
ncbi:MAG: cytochrome c3 family protein [Pseudomonadota bacterium]